MYKRARERSMVVELSSLMDDSLAMHNTINITPLKIHFITDDNVSLII